MACHQLACLGKDGVKFGAKSNRQTVNISATRLSAIWN
jgi:hypothetical protein